MAQRVAAIVLLALPSIAIAAPLLPSGTYAVNGAFTAYSGEGCIILAKAPVTGVFVYAGPGNSLYGSSLILESADARTGVAAQVFTAFPPPPGTGLNGWAPSPNYNPYINGKLENGGAGALITFAATTLFASPSALAQATLTILAPGCTETLVANLARIGNVLK